MIRKTLTAACAVAALALGLASPAFAKDVVSGSETFVFTNPDVGLNTFGSFASAGTYTANQTFDEIFLFYSPDIASQATFEASADKLSGSNTVKFTGIDYGYILTTFDSDGDPVTDSLVSLALGTKGISNFAVFGQTSFADTGLYYFEIQGVSLVAGGSFSGDVGTLAIPEPTNTALLLAGLGLFATVARRRKQSL